MNDGGAGWVKARGKDAVRGLVAVTAGALGRLVQRPWAAETARRVLDRQGFHLLRKHFYLPIPDLDDLDEAFWTSCSALVGLQIDEAQALGIMEDVVAPFLPEFRRTFPIHGDPRRSGFHLMNGRYMAVDAHVYFAFIRRFRPRRVIEIGGGYSSLVAVSAVRANTREDDTSAELTIIEPYPEPDLVAALDGAATLVQAKVQDVPVETFTNLDRGDILFIDSSHVLRAGGDVQFEYLEVLPRLAPGVLVHVHDVSLPRPYPKVYFEQQRYWNEQYLLQAFLAFNRSFEVVWPGALMAERHPERVSEVFPEVAIMRQLYPDSTPTAFWMRVRS